MRRELIFAAVALCFSYLLIYTIANFIRQILQSQYELTINQVNSYNRIVFIRIFTGHLIAIVIDKYKMHSLAAMIILTTQSCLIVLCKNLKVTFLNKYYVGCFYNTAIEIGNSGLLPCLEIFAYNVANKYGEFEKNYIFTRMATVFGKCLSDLINMYIPIFFPAFSNECALVVVVVSCIVSCLFFILADDSSFTNNASVEKECCSKSASIKKFYKHFFNIMRIEYTWFLVFFMIVGLSRSILQDFQTMILSDPNVNGIIRMNFIVRTIANGVITLFAHKIHFYISITFMGLLGGMTGLIDVISYYFIPMLYKGTVRNIYFVFLEVYTSYSCIFLSYSVTKFTKLCYGGDFETTVQAVFSGVHSGLAPTIKEILVSNFTAESDKRVSLIKTFLCSVALLCFVRLFQIVYVFLKKKLRAS